MIAEHAGMLSCAILVCADTAFLIVDVHCLTSEWCAQAGRGISMHFSCSQAVVTFRMTKPKVLKPKRVEKDD